MTRPYSHLEDPAREVIELSANERLAWLQGQHLWIPYAVATEILSDMQSLINRPRHHRMRGMLIISASNNGKSRLALECLHRNPVDQNQKGSHIHLPVFLLEMPPHPDEAAIYDMILLAMNQPFRRHDKITEKRTCVIQLFQRCQLKALLVDEIQRLLGSRMDMRRVIMDALRFISTQVPVPLIVLSTERGANALSSSDEMINRTPPTVIPLWKLDGDFRKLLSNHEGILPLREHSRLTTRSTAALIHTMSEGHIGEVRDLLELATAMAFNDGLEKIDEPLLRKIRWTPPSARKRLVGVPGKV